MEDLLTPVSTAYKTSQEAPEEFLVEVKRTVSTPAPETHNLHRSPDTPEGILEALRHQPDFQTLSIILQQLDSSNLSFDIKLPSPIAAQIVNVLVAEVIPSYWSILKSQASGSNKKSKSNGKKNERHLLLDVLRSVTGLNAILGRIKALIQEERGSKGNKASKEVTAAAGKSLALRELVEVIQGILESDLVICDFHTTIQNTIGNSSRQTALWQEFVALIGGGRILSNIAEAVAIINDTSRTIENNPWIADGTLYCGWLGRNLCQWAKIISTDDTVAWKNCSSLTSKSFRLGHTDKVVLEVLSGLLLQRDENLTNFQNLLSNLPTYDQKTFIISSLKFLTQKFSSNQILDFNAEWWKEDDDHVAAAAGLLAILLADEESRKKHVINWLTSASGAGIGESINIRRAALAALSKDRHAIENVLEKSLVQFGDQLYIKHTPVLQQEVHTQVLLLAAGYVHRTSPMRLSMIMRSGNYLGAISNRLASSSTRARILGMIVGETLSGFVDKAGQQMSFKMEETETPDAKWYKSLVSVKDNIGSMIPLKSGAVVKMPKKISAPKPKYQKLPQENTSKIVAIEELSDSDSDDDGPSYQKPDSDAEDSDEDATLVTRNKPTAPVYIRDLITYIRNNDSYDHQLLALTTAPSLIRRKATFGTEVSSHATELATLLVGLQDKYDISNFQDLRLQSLISLLTSVPTLGPWFAKTFFDGDYSISQRASILTVLGLSARELGGFGAQDAQLSKAKPSAEATAFPSKILPPKMAAIYAPAPADPVAAISSSLASTMLAPLAASAADQVTGPNILKTRTFSSRLAVEARRSKPIPNALATLVGSNFFFPLTGRFSAHLRAYGAGNVVFSPFLLSTFLKTLAIILHASGPATVALPQMTSEFLDLLLSLRQGDDVLVVEAVLFGVLTILELHDEAGGRTLAETHSRELIEVQGWTEVVFGRLSGGGEDERVRSLAAGVLVRISGIVEKYQGLLVGDLGGF